MSEWSNTSIHSLTTALDDDEWSLLRSTDLSPGKETRMEDGSQVPSGRFGVEQISKNVNTFPWLSNP
jgi:hypothetical protein